MNTQWFANPLGTAGAAPRAPALQPAADADALQRDRLGAAAEKFEAFFITEMLRQMRRSTRELAGEDSVFGQRINEDMMDMADTVMADSLAGRRAFGIADAIVRQLLPAPQPAAPAAGAALPLKSAADPVALDT